MSSVANLDATQLSVVLDLRHPLAYLALHPTLAFERELGLAVNWLPITVPSLNAPGEPGPADDRGVTHRRIRAQAIAREIDAYSAAQGLTIREPYRAGDASAANLAWLFVRERAPERLEEFLVELFRRYWALELDPADANALVPLVDEAKADGADYLAWQSGEGANVAETLAGELRELGLFNAPAFVVEDEVFFGRQHLPMVRWILEGRTGPVPI